MTKLHKHAAICAGVIAGAMLLARPGLAEDAWQRHHPRRHEVNHRLNHEDERINQGLKDHQLTKSEAGQLRSEDNSIRHQEQYDASHDNGHITKSEQQQLNGEENNLSNQIHQDRQAGQ